MQQLQPNFRKKVAVIVSTSIKFDVDDLKAMLMSNEKEFRYFNTRVLTPAVNDINQYTEYRFASFF